jgi:hypothetical protein
MNKLDEMLLLAIRKDFLEAIDIAKNVFAAIEAYME